MEPSPGSEGGSLPASDPAPNSRAAAAAAAEAAAAAAAAAGPGRYSQIETRAKEPVPADLTNLSSDASIVERTPPADERNIVVGGAVGALPFPLPLPLPESAEEDEPPPAAAAATSAPSAVGGDGICGGGGARSRSPLPALAAEERANCWLNEAVMAAVPSIVLDFGVGARGGRRPGNGLEEGERGMRGNV